MSERIYCCEQNTAEPMIGTADRVDVWILLEYRPVWKAKALEQSDLAAAVREWLAQGQATLSAAGLKSRVQLVRQPERESDEVRLLIGLPGTLLQFTGRGYDFLEALDLAAIVADPGAHPRLDEPRYFVCTNGQRDVCCSRFGLPVYAELRQRVGARVWQVTHLGGHRFAPNVLVLPQGVLYGRVAADGVDAFVRTIEAGDLAFPNLRGRTRYPPAVQAAEFFCGRSNLALADVQGDDAAAQVSFASPNGPVTLRVRRSAAPVSVQKSCGDGKQDLVYPYQLE